MFTLLAYYPGFSNPAYPVEKPYQIEEDSDDEYFMDVIWMTPDRDWNKAWRGADNGARIDMGSLNVKQWRMDMAVRVAADFTSWLRFYYRNDYERGLEPLTDEHNRSEFELEFRPFGRWYISLRTDPAFWKKDADAGFSAKYRKDNNNYLSAGYTAIDFDNNYSFERSLYDQGFNEYYALPAYRWELDGAAELPKGIAIRGSGFYRPESVKHYRYFYGQAEDYTRTFGEYSARVESEFPVGPDAAIWAGYAKDRREEEMVYPRGSFADSYAVTVVYDQPGAEFKYVFPAGNSLRAGARYRRETRGVIYPFSPIEDYRYRKGSIAYYAIYRFRAVSVVYVESGYLGMYASMEQTGRGRSLIADKDFIENRIPLALDFEFGDRLRFRLASGIELDKPDIGAYSVYDKAFVSVMACF